ncbi:MAG TPA: PilZ domain-containing protein [Thermoanaerobaculia bacterium]|nr:PilZ domain-containing protein [Thermoanaerobaculia bacterium]
MIDPRARAQPAEAEGEIVGARARRHPRLSRPGVKGRLPLMTTARLIDLSLGGAGVLTEAPLSAARSYLLVFDDGNERFEREARVVWNRPAVVGDEARRSYRVGVAFEDGSIDAIAELLEFINRHEGADETGPFAPAAEDWTATRTATRYQLRDVQSLRILADHAYDIRNLSLSGMLIETRVPLRPEMRVALVLELPDGEVRTVARVVTVTPRSADRAAPYRAGVEFVELDDADRDRLEAFLQRHAS